MSLVLKNWLVAATPRFLRPTWQRLEASPLRYRLARGAFWSLAGTLIARTLGLCASIVVARMLGKAVFGELGMIQSTVGLFGTFAGFGLGLTATKHVAELRVKDPARAGRIIGLSSLVSWASGGALAAVLFWLAPWLAAHTLAAPHLAKGLMVASGLLLLGAVGGAQTGALSGFEAFKQIAQINFWSGIASFPLMVGGVSWLGLEGALWGLVAGQGLVCALSFLALRRQARFHQIPLGYRGCAAEREVLWRFSLPALFAGATAMLVNWVCGALLVNQPGGYAEMGIFNAANQWFNALLFLPTVLGQAFLPVVAERLSNDDLKRSSKVLAVSIKLNALVMLVPILVGCLLSPFIMASYGPGFRAAWPTLAVALLTAGALGIQIPVGQIIIAAGRMWLGTLMNLGWGLVFLLGTLFLLHHGAFGLALARLSAYVLHALWTLGFALAIIRLTGKTAPEPTRPSLT